jgi:KaiC/GvpD/RAD55 family RecA-like ATPase
MRQKRIKFGIKGLDDALHGGLIPERPYIISGASGSGKTLLAMQFLVEGLEKGENVLFVALEEPINEIKQNINSFDWNVNNIEILDANSDIRRYEPTPVLEISSLRKPEKIRRVKDSIRKTPRFKSLVFTIHSIQSNLQQAFRRKKYDRVVIDSLTAIRFFCMVGGEDDEYIQSFVRFLSESKITSLLTVETPEIYRFSPEIFLARGEIRLHKLRDEGGINRFVSIEKYRGSDHEYGIYPMRIESRKGIVVENKR